MMLLPWVPDPRGIPSLPGAGKPAAVSPWWKPGSLAAPVLSGGVIPKKVLVNAAEVVGKGSDLQGKGIQAPSEIRWPDLIRFKRTLTDPMPGIVKKKLENDQHERRGPEVQAPGRTTREVIRSSIY
jgi:hypothetical protein